MDLDILKSPSNFFYLDLRDYQNKQICKLSYKFESLIYSPHRLNNHVQDLVLYNGRMLEGTLLLVCSLHWFGNFSLNM